MRYAIIAIRNGEETEVSSGLNLSKMRDEAFELIGSPAYLDAEIILRDTAGDVWVDGRDPDRKR